MTPPLNCLQRSKTMGKTDTICQCTQCFTSACILRGRILTQVSYLGRFVHGHFKTVELSISIAELKGGVFEEPFGEEKLVEDKKAGSRVPSLYAKI